MGTPTQYYVDTVSGSDAAAGTSFGAAWLTLKHAIETGITRDATNGDQINIYAPSGTPDNYSSGDPAIVLGDYASTASATAPLNIRGIASDGTTPAIAYVTFSGRYLFNLSTFSDLSVINLSMIGGSATGTVQAGTRFFVIGCLIDGTGGGVSAQLGQASGVIHSDVQGASGSNALLSFNHAASCKVIGSYIHERTNACFGIIGAGTILGNIVHVASTNSNAFTLNCQSDAVVIIGNTIVIDTASTSIGIVTAGVSCTILNNYIEGYSGAGGDAIVNTGANGLMIAGNRYFNCAAGVTPGDLTYAADNSATSASGITSLAGADYTPTSELKAIGLPLTIAGSTTYINVGVIQNTNAASGVVDPMALNIPGV